MKFFASTAAILAVTCLACQVQAADTLAKVADAGKILVAYRESSIPFSYLAGPSTPVGFSVDITRAIVEAIKVKTGKPNLETQWIAVTTQNRIPLLRNGTIDVECGSTVNTSARAKEVDFSTNFFYTGTRLLVKKSSGIRNYNDLKGKSVSSTTGAVNYQVLRKYSADNGWDIEFQLAKDHTEGFLQVQNDRAAAFTLDDVLLYSLKATAKNPNDFEVVGDTLQVEPYACMVRKDDPELKQLVDAVITGMMKSGEFEKRYTQWFMQPIPPQNVSMGLPISDLLKEGIKSPSDKPAR